MAPQHNRLTAMIADYVRNDAGVATVDWVIVCAGATGMALATYSVTQETFVNYSFGVRDEVQAPYFDAWTDHMMIPPEEIWGEAALDATGGNLAPPGPPIRPSGGDTTPDPEPTPDQPDTPPDLPDTPPDQPDTPPDQPDTPPDQPDTPPDQGADTPPDQGGGGGGLPDPVFIADIEVRNGGFETTDLDESEFVQSFDGWVVLNDSGGSWAGVWNPLGGDVEHSTITGKNVGFLNNPGNNPGLYSNLLTQVTSTEYSADQIYEFSIDIGDSTFFGSGNDPYELNIYAGGTLIGSKSGVTGNTGELETVTVRSDVADASLNGDNIRFELVYPSSQTSGELVFDNIVGAVLEVPTT